MLSLCKEFREFISVESLDYRVLPKSAIHRRIKSTSHKHTQSKSIDEEEVKNLLNVTGVKPLWRTPEFFFYYLMFIIVVPWMIFTAMSASNEYNPNYERFEGLLTEGWLFDREVDNSDPQYRFFRDNLLLLAFVAGAHITIKRLVLHYTQIPKLKFDFLFGIVYVIVFHGINSVRLLGHILIMYCISHILRKKQNIAIVSLWVYGIGSLFINHNFRKYPFANILSILSPLDNGYKGIIERWDVFYNFTLLRILSYNFDYVERYNNITEKFVNSGLTSPLRGKESSYELEPVKSGTLMKMESISGSGQYEYLTERARLVAPFHLSYYNIINYIAYVTYTPLFITGPIITFNDYVYQTLHTLPSINKKRIVSYAIKVFIAIMTMEFILHFTYISAVTRAKAWDGDTPFQISMIGLMSLNIIWLKLMIPWRLFRLWALIDGIDTPENMIRCVDNNYSAIGFWRAWHRSFNKWVIRYIYIPLGGSKNRILSSIAVFSFVAIWHDIELRLLLWGWLIVLFLLPEIFLTNYFAQFKQKWWYRHVCGLGAVVNIWMMMIANLYGFCLNSDGTKKLINDIFSSVSGITFFFASTACLFIAVQVMFEQREEEKRRGINLKC